MKAVIYARYSAGPRQTDQSIDGQLRICKEFCKQKGFTLVGEYCDRHISGRTDERPEFQKLITDAKAKKFEVVVVYKTDRFARNKYDSAIYKRELKKNGIKIFYAAETIPDGPEGIILESLMEGLAEYYSAELSQKIKRGMAESAYKCQSTGSGRPLGYFVDENKHFQIDEEAAKSVRTIFDMYIKGEPLINICNFLNSRGMKTSRGNPFNKSSINKIIKNRKYIGEYKYQNIVIKDGMPRIISDDVFNLAQIEMQKRRSSKKPKTAKAEYLLSGKLFCGHCKSSMQGVSGTGKTGNKWYYYYCSNARQKKGCSKKQINRDKLEKLVTELTIQYILQKDVLTDITHKLLDLQSKQQKENSDIKFYEKKIAKNKVAISNLLLAIESGSTSQVLLERLQQLELEQYNLQSDIKQLKNQKLIFDEDKILFMLMNYLEPYPDETEREYQKRIISCFVAEVYIYDNSINIFFNVTGSDNHLQKTDLQSIENNKLIGFDLQTVSSTNLIVSRTTLAAKIIILSYGFVLNVVFGK